MGSPAIIAMLVLAGAAHRGAAEPKLLTEDLEDGTRLAVVQLPGATRSSIRVVVGSGSSSDPTDRSGLAHLVEHLVMQGSYAKSGEDLANSVRAAGGTLNAFTTPGFTMFTLDAPAPAFTDLAGNLIEIVTNPALTLSSMDSEKGVIANERAFRKGLATGLLSDLDEIIFPVAGAVQRTGIGSRKSVRNIQMEDITGFYSSNYRAANITFVIVGPGDLDAARALVTRHDRIAPQYEQRSAPPASPEPVVPVDVQAWFPVSFMALGYPVPADAHGICRELASLLELRLISTIRIQKALASDVSASCVRVRGRDFLIAQAYTTSFGAADLPDSIREAFASLGTRPATSEEERILRLRSTRARELLLTEPEQLADEVAVAAGASDLPHALDVLAPPAALNAREVSKVQATFTPDDEIQILFSPFRD